MHKAPKHHYIPSFYTKRWAGPNGQLIEYRRGYQNRVFERPTFPDGTGYLRGLNTIDGLPPHLANALEDRFLQKTDDLASKALDQLLLENNDVGSELKSGWARFIMSLFHRTPERVKYLKINVDAEYKKSHDERQKHSGSVLNGSSSTFEKHEDTKNLLGRAFLMFFEDIVDSSSVGSHINRLIWSVVTLHKARFPLLTSDRPLVMTNGLDKPGAHIVMPISPNKIFIAAKGKETLVALHSMAENGKMLMDLNDRLVRQARKYVYASEPLEFRYLEKRLGQKIVCSPLRETPD